MRTLVHAYTQNPTRGSPPSSLHNPRGESIHVRKLHRFRGTQLKIPLCPSASGLPAAPAVPSAAAWGPEDREGSSCLGLPGEAGPTLRAEAGTGALREPSCRVRCDGSTERPGRGSWSRQAGSHAGETEPSSIFSLTDSTESPTHLQTE